MAGPHELQRLQLAFWTAFAEVVPDYGFSPRKAAPKNWYYLPIGTSRAKIVLTIEVRDQLLGCKLSVDHSPVGTLPDAAEVICSRLAADRGEIEAELGFVDLDWGTPTVSRIYRYRHAVLDESADWPQAFEWLGTTAGRFKRVFGPRVARVQIPLTTSPKQVPPASATPRRRRPGRDHVSATSCEDHSAAHRSPDDRAMRPSQRLHATIDVKQLFRRVADGHDLELRAGERAGDPTLGIYSLEKEPLYRYAFAQWWGAGTPSRMVAWVLLNPAPGDTDGRARPVLQGCLDRARRWSFSGLVIVNLFAYRTRNPEELDPDSAEGPHNDASIRAVTEACGLTMTAWGDGTEEWRRHRAAMVLPMLRDPHCLEVAGKTLTRFGQPLHPLYKPLDAPRVPLPANACPAP
jgi:hypothetical protein